MKELLALADNIEVEEELTSRDGEDGETVRTTTLRDGLTNVP